MTSMKLKFANLIGLSLLLVLVLAITPIVRAQATYDYAWLKSIAGKADVIDQINAAWETRSGDQWKAGAAKAGVYDIPANSVVIGSLSSGNIPAFEAMATNVWYTAEGGHFGTTEGYRAFQLDGAINAQPVAQRPTTVTQMLAKLNGLSYGQTINTLDVEWSNSPAVVNRWGSAGWQELLSAKQQDLLKSNGQRPEALKQLLPGNVVVWGELAPGNQHWGLKLISKNVYVTTGKGGLFVTDRGFRAMQYASQ